jgi:hypothetical protein
VLVGLVVLVAAIAGAIAVSASHAQASKPSTQHRATTCVKSITVIFSVYQGFADPGTVSPAPNGCWSYARTYQNGTAYTTCYYNKANTGTGSNHVYDDTNPSRVSTDTSRINGTAPNGCGGSVWSEYLGPSTTSLSCNSTCWSRNGTGSPSHYFAELYAGDGNVDNLYSFWNATGYGASPSNSAPAVNIRPLAYNAQQNTTPMYDEVMKECGWIGSGGFMAMYAGIADTTPHTLTSSTDQAVINNTLNLCTTGQI